MHNDDLRNVKVGDFLIQHGTNVYGAKYKHIVSVVRLTPTRVYIDKGQPNTSYRKTGGHLVSGRDRPTANFCLIPAEGDVEALRLASETKQLRNTIIKWMSQRSVSYETLLAIEQILSIYHDQSLDTK